MEDLLRSNQDRKHLSEPLPVVFDSLSDVGFEFRRGKFTLVSAAPNRGKSLFALTLAIKAGVRVLYISPDCDQTDMLYRSCSILTGDLLIDVEEAFINNREGFYEDVVQHSGIGNRIRFVWDSQLDLHDVQAEIDSFGMVFGDYPELIVVDNVSDLYAADDDIQNLRIVSEWLKAVAHDTSASVLGLHHLTGDFDDGTSSPPLSAIRAKINKKPDGVITLWGPPTGEMVLANIVKNRGGPASASGNLRAEIKVDYSRAEML